MCNCYNCSTYNSSSSHYCSNCRSPLLLLDKYRIIKILGGGGRGKVYLANQPSLARTVAIKQILGELLVDPTERAEAIEQFKNEAQILASLHHDNLPEVYDNFEDSINFYLVMEYVEGKTVEQILNNTTGFLPEKEVKDWAIQICNVLGYLHTRIPPIVFRDIKPANIMVNKEGVVKLIDFGIARHVNPARAGDTVKMGTIGYAPPEQFRGESELRSDIYALGATLYYLITKHDPQNDFLFSTKPVKNFNPQVSDSFASVIHKAIQSEPANRFSSAKEMMQGIQGASIVGPPVDPPSHLADVNNLAANPLEHGHIQLTWDLPPNVGQICVRRSLNGPVKTPLSDYAVLSGQPVHTVMDKNVPIRSKVFYTVFCRYQNSSSGCWNWSNGNTIIITT
jgi:serine/threonine protein kinase